MANIALSLALLALSLTLMASKRELLYFLGGLVACVFFTHLLYALLNFMI